MAPSWARHQHADSTERCSCRPYVVVAVAEHDPQPARQDRPNRMTPGTSGVQGGIGRGHAAEHDTTGGAAEARRRFAALALANDWSEALTIGDVTLLPHQVHAVHRLRAAMQALGGALLADETGLGKTYVALALAASVRHALVVAPAALAPMWAEALRRTGVRASFRTTESLSRVETVDVGRSTYDLVVVDEAQHFRNPATRRYDRLARLLGGTPVLLLSATPVHNHSGDLRNLLALFAGAAAWTLDAATVARCVVRRDAAEVSAPSRPPTISPLVWLPGGDEPTQNDLLDAILELPPPLPTRDGGDAGALLAHGLVRQWSSSIGALTGALRRRLVRAEALLAALDSGHHLGSAELRRWAVGDDAVQLPLPGLFEVVGEVTPSLREALIAHRDGVRALLRQSSQCDDNGRADALRAVRHRHDGAHVVAFSQYSDTVDALYRLLERDGGVCALHGDSARVAGGMLTRDEALRRFAPLAHGVAPPIRAERITMLIATDVVSEGINLQDASVVVHLDLPWTAARLEQRVGRAARLGSPHASIQVYALSPPARSERLLGVERRLRRKWRDAGRAVGVRGAILPPLAPPGDSSSGSSPASSVVTRAKAPPVYHTALHARLRRWRDTVGVRGDSWIGCACSNDDGDARAAAPVAGDGGADDGAGVGADGDVTVAGALQAPPDQADAAFLAAIVMDGRTRILAGRSDRGPASDDPALAAAVADLMDRSGAAARPDAASVRWAHEAVAAWHRGRAAADALAIVAPGAVPLQRRLLARLAHIVRSTPLHQRSAILDLAAAARRSLTRPLGVGGERVLAEIVSAPMADAFWLRTLAAFADSEGRRPTPGDQSVATAIGDGPELDGAASVARTDPAVPTVPRISALLILVPPARE